MMQQLCRLLRALKRKQDVQHVKLGNSRALQARGRVKRVQQEPFQALKEHEPVYNAHLQRGRSLEATYASATPISMERVAQDSAAHILVLVMGGAEKMGIACAMTVLEDMTVPSPCAR